jgi:Fic family protein/DNA-binding transcriptional ArsR family regulator
VTEQRRLARAAAGVGGDDTARQILGNLRAMQSAIRLATEPRAFELEDLLEIHRTLLRATRDEHLVGTVREQRNWIGASAFSPAGAEFIPPPEDKVPDLLLDLVAFVNRDDLPVAMQAAIAHAQFETIHPFADGNGRAGRCLIHVVYRRRGVAPSVAPPISPVLATHAKQYIGGLEQFRFGELAESLLFFAVATLSAARNARALAAGVETLCENWLAKLGNPRADASSRRIANQLPAEPIITIARAAEIASVSNTAADNAVRALQAADVLKPDRGPCDFTRQLALLDAVRGRSCAVGHRPITYNRMVVGLLTSETLSGPEADRVFHALADITRRDILARAIQREQSVSTLARRYEISLTAVQKHVAVLERAALVNKRRSGREQRVAANPEMLRKAATLLAAFEQLWIQRATKIAEILAEEGAGP